MKKILIILVFAFNSCSESNEWYQLELKKMNSKIEFPSKPIERLEASNKKIPFRLFTYQAKDSKAINLAYIFGTAIYPDSIAHRLNYKKESMLEYMVKESIKKETMKMISLKKIKIGKVEGLELKVNLRKGKFIMTNKYYLDGKIIYVLNSITRAEFDSNIEQNKFFESFEILKQ